jgi:hypothetical protein
VTLFSIFLRSSGFICKTYITVARLIFNEYTCKIESWHQVAVEQDDIFVLIECWSLVICWEWHDAFITLSIPAALFFWIRIRCMLLSVVFLFKLTFSHVYWWHPSVCRLSPSHFIMSRSCSWLFDLTNVNEDERIRASGKHACASWDISAEYSRKRKVRYCSSWKSSYHSVCTSR